MTQRMKVLKIGNYVAQSDGCWDSGSGWGLWLWEGATRLVPGLC